MGVSRPGAHSASAVHYCMGSLIEISVSGGLRASHLHELVHRSMEEFEKIEALCSLHDPQSELSIVNRSAFVRRCPISPDLVSILSFGFDAAARFPKAFSICLRPLFSLWTQAASENLLPSAGCIRAALAQCGARSIEFDRNSMEIRFCGPDVAIDLNGLAKGIAADRATDFLMREGVSRIFVNAGRSSFRTLGFEGKRIGIAHPAHEDRVAAEAEIAGSGISSSGTLPQSFRIGDQIYSHLINPATGWPLDGQVLATAFASSAAIAEVASKVALFSPRELPAFSAKEAVQAVVLTNSESGGLRIENYGSRVLPLEIAA